MTTLTTLILTVIDGEQQYEILCDCGARLDYMGHVHGDTLRIDAERCACDSRCTSAIGPNCVCQCGGVNHGTNRVVHIQIITGSVPQVTARANLATRCAQVAHDGIAGDRTNRTGGGMTDLKRAVRCKYCGRPVRSEHFAPWGRCRNTEACKRRAERNAKRKKS